MTNSRYSPSLRKHIAVETLDTGDVKPSKARRQETKLFIKVPLRWAVAACEATNTPKALVGLLLLLMSWRARSTSFACPNGLMKRCGISRQVKYRALAEFEAAGLITVQQQRGRAPIVTLIGV